MTLTAIPLTGKLAKRRLMKGLMRSLYDAESGNKFVKISLLREVGKRLC